MFISYLYLLWDSIQFSEQQKLSFIILKPLVFL